jgi:hypothetical protein
MSKTQAILDAYARYRGVLPETQIPAQVAREVGTTPAYVRTVARQRKGKGRGANDLRYLWSPHGKQARKQAWKAARARVQADPVRHAKLNAWRRQNYHSVKAREALAAASPAPSSPPEDRQSL